VPGVTEKSSSFARRTAEGGSPHISIFQTKPLPNFRVAYAFMRDVDFGSKRLTRKYCASTLVRDGFGQTNSSDVTRSRSRSVRIRLQCRGDARTGDAVLQCDALLVAWSPRSGLLQDHAIHARAFCAGRIRAWHHGLPSCVRACFSVRPMPWLRFLCSKPRTAMPRPAHFLLSGFPASSHLV
jgi:hypothetical protein